MLKYKLTLVLAVDNEPDACVAEKTCSDLAEVTADIEKFVEKFGLPDKGRQTIEITLVSEP